MPAGRPTTFGTRGRDSPLGGVIGRTFPPPIHVQTSSDGVNARASLDDVAHDQVTSAAQLETVTGKQHAHDFVGKDEIIGGPLLKLNWIPAACSAVECTEAHGRADRIRKGSPNGHRRRSNAPGRDAFRLLGKAS